MKNIFEVSEKELETIAGGVDDGDAFLYGAVSSIPVLGNAVMSAVAIEGEGANEDQKFLAAGVAAVGSVSASLGLMGIGAGLLKLKQWLKARSKKAKAREMREIMDMARNLK